jgi:hypothetical protein
VLTQTILALGLIFLLEGKVYADFLFTLTQIGPAGTPSAGVALNNSGQATGTYDSGAGTTNSFFWDGTASTAIPSSGAGDTFARDISSNGTVVGRGSGQPFRWDSTNGMTFLGPANGEANGINSNGDVIGTRNLGSSDRTNLWSPSGGLTNPYPTVNSRGVAINDNGQFAGTTNNGTLGYYSPGATSPRTSLGTFLPTDITNSRVLSGSVGTDAGILTFDTNNLTNIGKLSPTDSFASALGINNSLTAVGFSEGSGAFIYDSTLGMRRLTGLLDSRFAGWTILSASDINDPGMIIATGRFNGVNQAVLLTPMTAVPEPSFGDLLEGISVVHGWVAEAIVGLCAENDECPVRESAPAGLTLEEADSELVEKVSNTLEELLRSNQFSSGSKLRAEKALRKLRAN